MGESSDARTMRNWHLAPMRGVRCIHLRSSSGRTTHKWDGWTIDKLVSEFTSPGCEDDEDVLNHLENAARVSSFVELRQGVHFVSRRLSVNVVVVD